MRRESKRERLICLSSRKIISQSECVDRFHSLTAESGKCYRCIKEPTEFVQPATTAPDISRHIGREAYRSAGMRISPQKRAQRVRKIQDIL